MRGNWTGVVERGATLLTRKTSRRLPKKEHITQTSKTREIREGRKLTGFKKSDDFGKTLRSHNRVSVQKSQHR